jgi:hypothetical protein
MAEDVQGLPGGEGPDGALPGVSAVAALNLSPKPGDPEGNLLLAEKEIAAALVLEPSLRYVVFPSSSPARTRPWSPSTMMRKTPNVARAPGSSQASPGSLGSTSPTVFPKEFLARP